MSRQKYTHVQILLPEIRAMASGRAIVSSNQEELRQDVMSFAYERGELFVEELQRNGRSVYTMPRPRKEGYASGG